MVPFQSLEAELENQKHDLLPLDIEDDHPKLRPNKKLTSDGHRDSFEADLEAIINGDMGNNDPPPFLHGPPLPPPLTPPGPKALPPPLTPPGPKDDHHDGEENAPSTPAPPEPLPPRDASTPRSPSPGCPASSSMAPLPRAPKPPVSLDFKLKKGSFGIFKLTPKPKASQFGDYQISCPFHRRSCKTGCKKTKSILGPTKQDEENARHFLCWWACQAPRFNRQRSHVAYDPTDVPSAKEIRANKITKHPHSGCLAPTDVTLDKQDPCSPVYISCMCGNVRHACGCCTLYLCCPKFNRIILQSQAAVHRAAVHWTMTAQIHPALISKASNSWLPNISSIGY